MAEGEPQPGKGMLDRSEGFAERLLGVLLDRTHEMPPQLIAEEARVGGRDVSILLQDYAPLLLVPLPDRGLVVSAFSAVTEDHYQRRRDDHGDWHAAAQRHLFNRMLGQLPRCLKAR